MCDTLDFLRDAEWAPWCQGGVFVGGEVLFMGCFIRNKVILGGRGWHLGTHTHSFTEMYTQQCIHTLANQRGGETKRSLSGLLCS